MSKQYLTTHTVDNAHITTIFSLAATPTALFSASGSSTLHIHSTTPPSFPLTQSLDAAHPLGCHHVATAHGSGTPGKTACSAGFGGEVRVWRLSDAGDWKLAATLPPPATAAKAKKPDLWALALSADEKFLACTTHDGKVVVWNLDTSETAQVYDTGSGGAGSFGLAVDLSADGKFTASGHQDGSVYVFNNVTGRLMYSLSGLDKAIRAVAFSPLGTRLAAAGDAGIIALYDMAHGEHVGNLAAGAGRSSAPTAGGGGGGGGAAFITSLDFSDTGEWLLSGAMDGRARVWSVERQACVATHAETDGALWCVRWLPKRGGGSAEAMRGESFVVAGVNRSITFYREATGA